MSDTSSRQQLVAGAADMIRRRGLNATSIREVAKHSGAPLGSTYHHFPGGKDELAAEAVRHAATTTARALDAALETGPVDGLRSFFALWRDILVRTDFHAGCPVLAVSVEEPQSGNEPTAALRAAADAFEGWEHRLAASLRAHGTPEDRAARRAALVVAAAEGAVAMSRARRSTRPLDDVAAELTELVATGG
ncbi:TetR/AcrR family transcriptional regulator [Saccharopolyspora sp. 6M]|uniref:TetR/AcrR family transcriptional regulator n=1 Tax=Saccharopolyspora sp. 6M TaxID=2877237 RepID=UPI001CD63867|nr:helix-turn-helix domain-containing protein [Saccharopolyspora sp. 6M]MCA1228142.1 TetR/AcrR family transcriptional regulator [Saccharopolyspora sp. 6M]